MEFGPLRINVCFFKLQREKTGSLETNETNKKEKYDVPNLSNSLNCIREQIKMKHALCKFMKKTNIMHGNR